MGLLVAQISIDDSSDKTITGRLEWDRTNGGILIPPSGTSFPVSPETGEWFWRTDEQKLYRRGSLSWDAVTAVPALHASMHQHGGSDEVATATAAANAIPKANGAAKLDIGWVPTGSTSTTVCIGNDARLSDARTPTAHATSHHAGGSDQLAHQSISGSGTNTHAQLDTHVGSTSNPHSVTKTQVGLGNVTDDAQLKRAAADFAAFTSKATPVSADVLLIEDSADSNSKKKVTVGSLPSSAGSVFGADFQSGVSEGTNSTTSSTFQDKLTLTTGALTGTYRVAFYCEASAGTSNRLQEVRLYDDTDATELCLGIERASTTDVWAVACGFQFITFAGAAKTFKVQYRSPQSVTVSIRRARIELWRVS